MKIYSPRDKILVAIIAICVIVSTIVLIVEKRDTLSSDCEQSADVPTPSEYLYGICVDSLSVISSEVLSGQTLSTLLDNYGVSQATVNKMVSVGKEVFDARQFKSGNKYTVLMSVDTIQSSIKYFIYEKNKTEYVVFNLDDTIAVNAGVKDIDIERLRKDASIESSLWKAMVEAGINEALVSNLSDVYQWSIDFYAIQKNDAFNVVYDEHYVDGVSIGAGTIYGAWFEHYGVKHYAIRYEYTDAKGETVVGYWDEEGKSLRKMFLSAPLKYTRISSTFSYSRMHPVLKVSRPHLGVDYAAPAGTPVQAIADGVITTKAFQANGGGNYLKIKHAQNYVSSYLHLKGYASGIAVGTRVKQGQIIGYVGSTGISTGPHLDFRITKSGVAIDPLKLSNTKGEDIEAAYKDGFMKVRDRIIAELEGREYIEPIEGDSLSNSVVTANIQ
ncbi:MAG: peptidoglycan DD-metalloendopeptidase family protein [Rikenellaceae bacterium]